MSLLIYLSNQIIPATIFFILAYALLHKKNVYEDFLQGASNGLKIVGKLLPTMLALMLAVSILRSSGLLSTLEHILIPLGKKIHFPAPLFPILFLRIFSTSAAYTLLFDLFREYGTDSRVGMIASIMMSCTETIFYTMSVYFLAVKITKTRWTLPGAFLATLAGTLLSVILGSYL